MVDANFNINSSHIFMSICTCHIDLGSNFLNNPKITFIYSTMSMWDLVAQYLKPVPLMEAYVEKQLYSMLVDHPSFSSMLFVLVLSS